MDREKLKEAFDAGRNYEADLNKYSGKPIHKETESFTKWYNRQVKNCLIADVVGSFSEGFRIDFVPNNYIRKGNAKLLIHPDDIPRK